MLRTHCFDIFFYEKRISLTSYYEGFYLGDTFYSHNSGLQIVRGIFNDSAQNTVEISGIFEKGGVAKEHDLTEAKIEITFLNSFSFSYTYYVSKFINLDLNFLIKAKTISARLNQSFLQYYSPTCRADFGDSRCGISKKEYSRNFKITNLEGREIRIEDVDLDYNNGSAKIGDENYKILSHKSDTIILDKAPLNKNSIQLTQGCDKRFETCCYKFKNSTNFRGEPFIPVKPPLE